MVDDRHKGDFEGSSIYRDCELSSVGYRKPVESYQVEVLEDLSPREDNVEDTEIRFGPSREDLRKMEDDPVVSIR